MAGRTPVAKESRYPKRSGALHVGSNPIWLTRIFLVRFHSGVKNMSDLCVGMPVTIKPEAWDKYLLGSGKDINLPKPTARIVIGLTPDKDHAMLDYPTYWWKSTDLVTLDQ